MPGKICSKRSQLKMAESIMILFIFIFLVIFGLVFYVKYSAISSGSKDLENAELYSIQSVQKVQFLPELQCSVDGNVDYNCIDLLKIRSFKKINENSHESFNIYETMFPNTKITVVQVHPDEAIWEIYGENIEGFNMHFYPVPTTTYDAESGFYGFGYINITVYQK